MFYGVFLGIYSQMPALHDSPKLMKMVRVKIPISSFGGLFEVN
jgi:hypothetical protein